MSESLRLFVLAAYTQPKKKQVSCQFEHVQPPSNESFSLDIQDMQILPATDSIPCIKPHGHRKVLIAGVSEAVSLYSVHKRSRPELAKFKHSISGRKKIYSHARTDTQLLHQGQKASNFQQQADLFDRLHYSNQKEVPTLLASQSGRPY
jgi:hypothetical protein